MLSDAIKGVYASVYFRDSKAYMQATSNVIDQEKMAVILQEVVGNQYGDRYYPSMSGVARSLNYYPLGDEKAEEGTVNLALGLGKYIVDGGMTLRFSPYHPNHVLQTSEMEIALKETQTRFYALDLKKRYNMLINECEKKIEILTALGDYDSKIDPESLINNQNVSKIDFRQLLKDFDSRIDSKLGLKLYSNYLPHIIENSDVLKKLGISMSKDSSRIKNKRESSGYVSDFFGLDSSIIPIKTELQVMYTNEHQESIIGYSAHSKMPGKEASFMEIPPAYVNRNMSILKNIGSSTFISNNELSLFNKVCSIKNLDRNNAELFKSLVSPSSVEYDGNSPIGVKIDSKFLQDLKDICTLNDAESESLKDILYSEGCKLYDSWVKNISAYHATARLDKDSSAKNRIKIHYDDPYECLAHTIREQIDEHTPNSIDAEYYLERVYKNQSEWLKKAGLMSTESSVIDFEIDDYAKNLLPKLLEKVNNNDIEK